ncbi:hypothetical protein Hanom_Chr07g00592701 [Helianthus anomalus]
MERTGSSEELIDLWFLMTSDNWLKMDFDIRWFCSDNQFWFILTINSISSSRL